MKIFLLIVSIVLCITPRMQAMPALVAVPFYLAAALFFIAAMAEVKIDED